MYINEAIFLPPMNVLLILVVFAIFICFVTLPVIPTIAVFLSTMNSHNGRKKKLVLFLPMLLYLYDYEVELGPYLK